MKGEPLKKPPPLLLPGKFHPRGMQARPAMDARYENFSGLIKRVCDMKLNYGMETDDTTTESESSSVGTRCSRNSGVPYGSSCEEAGSPFEDESSSSSVTGSDHSPPYEEIPTATNRYSCSSLPSPPPSVHSLHSFGESLPSPPTITPVYSNEAVRRNSSHSSSSSLYSTSDVVRRRLSRQTSLYSNCETDYSNIRPPLYSNTPEPVAATDVNENETTIERLEISENEKHQIEIFFRGLRTDVWVSTSLVNMYVCQKGQEWVHRYTGVPVLVLESGDTKSRNKRRIQIILAERGTCFPMWKDTIDNLSSYRKSSEAFHTMHLSTDHQQMVGLSFDSADEAERLLTRIDTLTADPENINISVPGAKKKKDKTKKKKPAPLPQKKQISNPCLFEHVTSVAAKDKPVYESLKTLLDQGMLKRSENTV